MTDRPASPGDDAVELASRYLDGDLGVDERAAAQADPEVMAWVERFGDLRDTLRQPLQVDAAVRDAAIAAALAAVPDAPASDAAPPPGIDDLAAARARRGRRMGSWLGAAAAVCAVAVGGVVLVGNSGGSDDSADDVATVADATELATATTEEGFEAQTSARSSLDAATEAPSGEDAPNPMSAEDRDEAATTAAGGAAPADASAETTAAATETTAAPFSTEVPSYAAPADLEPLVTALPVSMPDGSDPPCADLASGELVAADVRYAGVPAVVYRDAANHTLTAWAVDSCERLDDYVYDAG